MGQLNVIVPFMHQTEIRDFLANGEHLRALVICLDRSLRNILDFVVLVESESALRGSLPANR